MLSIEKLLAQLRTPVELSVPVELPAPAVAPDLIISRNRQVDDVTRAILGDPSRRARTLEAFREYAISTGRDPDEYVRDFLKNYE